MSTPERQRRIYLDGAKGQRPTVPIDHDKLEEAARRKVSTEAYAYIAGGAGRESTIGENRRALDRYKILPRMLRDVSDCDTSLNLFGNTLNSPIFTCPIGVLDLFHPEADLAVAKAASATGVPMAFSNQASVSMEECASAMGDGVRWFQLYWSKSDELVASLVKRAEECGCRAIFVTLDTTMLGWRIRDLDLAYLPFLAGRGIAQYVSDPVFQELLKDPEPELEPPKITLTSLSNLYQMSKRYPGSTLENIKTRRAVDAVRKFIAIYSRASLSWENLAFLREHTKLPIVLKGILAPDDALKALDHGVDGIYVSNHGGRQVDGAVGALDALAEVARVVDSRVPVLFDSGVRGGADIFKALCLGAKAVGIGRPFAYALAVGGERGVVELLQNYQADLRLTMGLSGVRSLAELNQDCLLQKNS